MALVATPRIDASLGSALRTLEELHAHLAHEIGRPLRFAGTLRRLALATSIEASTAIEGFRLPEEEALAVLGGREPAGDDASRQAVACYGRAMDHVLALAEDPHFEWSPRLLLDLHFDCCWFRWDRSPGRLRTGPISVVGGGRTRYEAPPAAMLSGLLDELVERLAAGGHPIVQGAMAHLHMASIHPFRDGNGRMARILQSLVLARGGILSPAFSSIEPYLARHTGEYYAALEQVQGGRHSAWGPADHWLAFCLQAHIEQARERIALVERAARRWEELEAIVERQGWPDRLAIALEQAIAGGGATRASYAAEAALSLATASGDLRRLQDAGLIVPQGRGRATRYPAADDLRRRIEADPPPA